MTDRSILLVDRSPDDEALTVRALRKNNLKNKLTIAPAGAEAQDISLHPRTGMYWLVIKSPPAVQ